MQVYLPVCSPWRRLRVSSVVQSCRNISSHGSDRRTYNDAIAALNSLQSNHAVLQVLAQHRKDMNLAAIPEMIGLVRRLGYEPADFDRLNPIHIAGTKGKGSTSAFLSSILSQYIGESTASNSNLQKIGLYTSPHLRSVRERIQINNEPLSEQAFAHYFFETWDRLESATQSQSDMTKSFTMPAYFRFLTLVAFHAYMSEGVDTAIFECGIGGEYDSTNVLRSPKVTGITSLGIDHVNVLGSTIEDIAWHKAGIMKPGAPCLTVPQPPAALKVLRQRAAEKGVHLIEVERSPSFAQAKLGLDADFQHTNASLAVAMASSYLNNADQLGSHSTSPLSEEFLRGLATVKWPGRCEVRKEPSLTWYIDSAHTMESITAAAAWFASRSFHASSAHAQAKPAAKHTRILLFNQQDRDPIPLIHNLYESLSSNMNSPFDHVVFCTNTTFRNAGFKPELVALKADPDRIERLEVQNQLLAAWQALDPSASITVKRTIEEAVKWCRLIAGRAADKNASGNTTPTQVFVTGSSHLVGGFLEVLETGS